MLLTRTTLANIWDGVMHQSTTYKSLYCRIILDPTLEYHQTFKYVNLVFCLRSTDRLFAFQAVPVSGGRKVYPLTNYPLILNFPWRTRPLRLSYLEMTHFNLWRMVHGAQHQFSTMPLLIHCDSLLNKILCCSQSWVF